MSQRRDCAGVSLGGIAAVFIAGAAIGAALGLLFAPGPGAETRASIKRRYEGLQDKCSEMRRRGEEFMEEAKHKVGRLAGDGKANDA